MAVLPKGLGKNSTVSKSSLFEYRKNYTEYYIPEIKLTATIIPEEDSNVLNYNGIVPFANTYMENSMFGCIDKEGDIIIPKSKDLGFVDVTGINAAGEMKLLNFVADAYKDFKDYCFNSITLGKVSADSPLMNFNITKAFTDINTVTVSYLNIYTETFKQQVIADKSLNNSIKDYKSFVNLFIDFLKKQVNYGRVVTKSSLVLHNFFSYFPSGMMFDIKSDRADDDLLKYNKYLNTPEFATFQRGCLRFGFKIDQNIPWRLLADINSPAMLPYLEKNGISSSDEIFTKYFKKAYLDDLEYLKEYFYQSYLYFLLDNEYYFNDLQNLSFKQLMENINKNSNVSRRYPVTREQFFKNFPNYYWLRLYTYFKNLETRRGFTQQEFDNVTRQASVYFQHPNRNFTGFATKFVNDYFKSYNHVIFYRALQAKSSDINLPASNTGMPNIVL